MQHKKSVLLIVYCAFIAAIFVISASVFLLQYIPAPLFIACSILIAGWFFSLLNKYTFNGLHAFLNRAKKTSGRITKVREKIFAPDAGPFSAGKKITIEFSYTDSSGAERFVRETHKLRLTDGFKVGDAIEVHYDEQNPRTTMSSLMAGTRLQALYR